MANVIIPVQKIANLVTAISSSSTDSQYPSALCVFNSIEGVKSAIGIPAFETTVAYAVGKRVVYSNAVYNCTTAHSAGAWNASHFTKLFDLDTGVPASGGTKLITNGQVYTALQDKADVSALRYAVVTKTPTVSSGTASISLDDRTCNSASTTSATVELTFPAVINGRARDFLLLLDTTGSSSAPTLAYASYMTIVADEDADLTPIVGQNLYTFTEIARNTFVATRTTLSTIATQVPQDAQGVVSAASQAGYDMTNVNTPGQLATALGLTNSADFEDCANKVMFG